MPAGNDLLLAAAIAVAVIAVGAGIAWHNNKTVQVDRQFSYTAEPANQLSFLSNWDGPAYLNIARIGYPTYVEASLFPFYPMVVYAVNRLIPSPLDSALLVSWLSFAGAIYFYIKIARKLLDARDAASALQAATFLVLFPTAVFFLATYTESLFAMLSLGAIYFALEKRWLWASLLLMLGTATHVTGVFVVVLVGLVLLEQGEKIRHAVASVIIGSAGLLGYTFYLYVHLHDAFAFLRSQTHIDEWMQHGFGYLISVTNYFNLTFIALLILSAWYWWRRGRRSFSVYSALFLLIPIAGRQYGGFNRYVLMAFPVQLMLYGFFKNRRAAFPYVAALMAVIWTYFLLQYAGGYIGSGS